MDIINEMLLGLKLTFNDVFDQAIDTEKNCYYTVTSVQPNKLSNGKCKDDHGERTNFKLNNQPFYHRGRNGKMRSY